MNRKEHLLTIAAEECNEVAQRLSKALRFTIDEVQPNQEMSNGDRILQEYCDLKAMIRMLQNEGHLPQWSKDRSEFQMKAKENQVEKYLRYSKDVGTLND